jgi:hypothetical protein
MWTANGQSIVEHVAGVEDSSPALPGVVGGETRQ